MATFTYGELLQFLMELPATDLARQVMTWDDDYRDMIPATKIGVMVEGHPGQKDLEIGYPFITINGEVDE